MACLRSGALGLRLCQCRIGQDPRARRPGRSSDARRNAAGLCLTFTRAAAAEMAERLFSTLAKWLSLSDDALISELHSLCGDVRFDGTGVDGQLAQRGEQRVGVRQE